jgi:hypothetical protein|eukprot:29560-Pelagococcus_subviridis.AAC.1
MDGRASLDSHVDPSSSSSSSSKNGEDVDVTPSLSRLKTRVSPLDAAADARPRSRRAAARNRAARLALITHSDALSGSFHTSDDIGVELKGVS